MTAIAILGANGRMGKALIRAIAEDDAAKLVSAQVRPGHALLGQDAGIQAGVEPLGVALSDQLNPGTQVVVDFTSPDNTALVAADCAAKGLALVVGTTGLEERHKAALVEAARQVPVVFAPNMSVGVNLLLGLVHLASQVLGDSVDIEVLEAHHRHKKDAPSGTALALGEAAAKALGRNLKECAVYGREGITGERDRQTIGFATVRAGDIIGEHTVLFAGEGERIELTHKAHNRDTFAIGALRAAHWLQGRAPGLYDMQDVLGLK
ncbi:4-hydroxy-tetrahydrodipicolinate reductase [Gallaecimonas kandeliae]|uniref:4-hydroxy-tetrahydrodipicolinate reductase n=1 Tax=Gallaecimonas kandeliae TaxID=3029055 RepID=UPI00264880C2|nr:4-hydroxy-tetrahydrodipicolinate reductase [Gallaecimonas kandeliae]WKE66579.1 4-hydroxy-tetrahydrodipicolinate reductase [Gallaecimonas kandeliae]